MVAPLSFSGNGTYLHSKFAFDMYEPGLCSYQFSVLFYCGSPLSAANLALPQLIEYNDDPSQPGETTVDLWCYPRPGGTEIACDSILAAAVQSMPRLPTREQADAAKESGDKEPPVLIGLNTRSLTIRVHDARIN
jgi:hypothetical protein